jgi:DNA polymerase I-like protein with 3'-5' exonuclease and polymerase domains
VLHHLMQRGGTIAIDTETTGLKIMEDKILFWSMATENRRWCFPAAFIYAFEPLFADASVSWCMANAKYDLHMLRNAGITIAGEVFDIMEQNVYLTDCLTIKPDTDDLRQIIYFPDGKIAYDWRYEGARLL